MDFFALWEFISTDIFPCEFLNPETGNTVSEYFFGSFYSEYLTLISCIGVFLLPFFICFAIIKRWKR